MRRYGQNTSNDNKMRMHVHRGYNTFVSFLQFNSILDIPITFMYFYNMQDIRHTSNIFIYTQDDLCSLRTMKKCL